jgi:hypothetical protein
MSEIDFDALHERARELEDEGAHDSIVELLIGQHVDAEWMAELSEDVEALAVQLIHLVRPNVSCFEIAKILREMECVSDPVAKAPLTT